MTKVIRIPGNLCGYDEPINGFEKIIESPGFQRLRDVKQLDMVYKIYPGATHTRFEHSFGAEQHARKIINSIRAKETCAISEKTGKTLELAALIHDYGHPPLSHSAEYVLMGFGEPNHDQKTIEKVKEMEEKIRPMNYIDFNLLVGILEGKSPLHEAVKGLAGADTLDYVSRDAERCGVPINSDTVRIESYAYFDGNKYGIETKAKESVGYHAQSYIHMYTDVYNRKACALLKSLARRGIYDILSRSIVKPEEIWNMTDNELICEFIHSGGLARETYKIIRDRKLPKTFLAVKIEGMKSQEETRRKPIYVGEMAEDDLGRIARSFEKIQNVIEFESGVERDMGFEPGSITLAEMPHLNKLYPRDVPLYNIDNGWTSLFMEIPGIEQNFLSGVRRKYSLRVAVSGHSREELYQKAPMVVDSLRSFI